MKIVSLIYEIYGETYLLVINKIRNPIYLVKHIFKNNGEHFYEQLVPFQLFSKSIAIFF